MRFQTCPQTLPKPTHTPAQWQWRHPDSCASPDLMPSQHPLTTPCREGLHHAEASIEGSLEQHHLFRVSKKMFVGGEKQKKWIKRKHVRGFSHPEIIGGFFITVLLYYRYFKKLRFFFQKSAVGLMIQNTYMD